MVTLPGGPDHQRSHFGQQLAELEARALGGLDLVCGQLDRVIAALEHQDVERGHRRADGVRRHRAVSRVHERHALKQLSASLS